MHTIKITPNLLFEYQCTSGKFIRFAESNRIETFFARIGVLYCELPSHQHHNTVTIDATDCSPPGNPPRRLLIINNWSVNWHACVQRSACTSCRISSHANQSCGLTKQKLACRGTARQVVGVLVSSTSLVDRRPQSITPMTVERVVAECTMFITHWSL